MPLFRRRKRSADDVGTRNAESSRTIVDDRTSVASMDSELRQQTQDVMADNLVLMKELVMRIRQDPDFAKDIYKNCPRLQHLLDQYPDLRPVFEDPKLVRVNFEQVYRDAGGVLPEDEHKRRWRIVVWFVNSPFCKLIKLLLFVKKILGCIAGGGFAFFTGCIVGCCFEDALDELETNVNDNDDLDEDNDNDQPMDPNREALNRAADHMEDPEVQEQMQLILENPEDLQDAIENDDELRALRDSNPLCQELMADPETMRVLTDPDNLRALGEAPSLIEADFADPDSFVPPDVEFGGTDAAMETGNAGMEYDVYDGGAADDLFDDDEHIDNSLEFEFDNDDDNDNDEYDQESEDEYGYQDDVEEEEEGAWWEDAEVEEQELDDNEPNNNNAQGGNCNKGQQQARSNNKSQQQQQNQNQNGEENPKEGKFSGIMASIGVAATDLVAGQIVGSIFGDSLIPGAGLGLGGAALAGGSGGGDLGGLESANVDADTGGINNVTDVAEGTGEMVDEDLVGVAADATDEADEKKDEGEGSDDESTDEDGNKKTREGVDIDADPDMGNKKSAGTTSAGVGAAARGTGKAAGDNTSRSQDDSADDEQEEKKEKKSRFGAIKDLGSAVMTAAKEHITTNLLGDDFGEELVERQEEAAEERAEKRAEKKRLKEEERARHSAVHVDGDDRDRDTPKSKRSLFRREKSKR